MTSMKVYQMWQKVKSEVLDDGATEMSFVVAPSPLIARKYLWDKFHLDLRDVPLDVTDDFLDKDGSLQKIFDDLKIGRLNIDITAQYFKNKDIFYVDDDFLSMKDMEDKLKSETEEMELNQTLGEA